MDELTRIIDIEYKELRKNWRPKFGSIFSIQIRDLENKLTNKKYTQEQINIIKRTISYLIKREYEISSS